MAGIQAIDTECLECLKVGLLYGYDVVMCSKRVWGHWLQHMNVVPLNNCIRVSLRLTIAARFIIRHWN